MVPEEHTGHMTRAEYEKGIRRPVRCGIAGVVLAAFTCVADLVLIFQNPQELIRNRELLFEAVSLLVLVLESVSTVQSWKNKAKFTIFE